MGTPLEHRGVQVGAGQLSAALQVLDKARGSARITASEQAEAIFNDTARRFKELYKGDAKWFMNWRANE